MGADSPVGLYDDEQYGDLNGYYGLLKACATPSTDHTGGLKRSARNSMNLLKYLVCDHVDLKDGEPTNDGIDATGLSELNAFAYSFCSLTPSQLLLTNFDAHLMDVRYGGNDGATRSGDKGSACDVLALIFTRHFDPNDIGSDKKPGSSLRMEDLIKTPEARNIFEFWMTQHLSQDVQNIIKKTENQTDSVPTQIVSKPKPLEVNSNPFGNDPDDIDIAIFKPDTSRRKIEAEASADRQHRLEKIGIKLDIVGKEESQNNGPPATWKDSALAKQQIQLSVAEGVSTTVDVTKEKWSKQIEERQIVIGRDPIGLRPNNFDLKGLRGREVDILGECIEDLNEEIEQGGGDNPVEEKRRKKKDKYEYTVEQLVSLEAQKSALDAILNGDQSQSELETIRPAADQLSILPADSNFDPLLFLTLVHRNLSYEQIQESIGKLESKITMTRVLCSHHFFAHRIYLLLRTDKTDNQTQRIQQLIRDNFDLFIRCADGIDLFKTGRTKKNTPGVNDWLDRLENLTESTSEDAKKSFKPLLDNTDEVRKVQSALAVLQRVGPLLQVPSLMRQHIENGRFSAAVSTYRRALVIDDNSKIKLLRHVKQKATEAANQARIDLETRLANPNLPVQVSAKTKPQKLIV